MHADTLAMVMAGGMGQRLRPLTEVRAKPAVPFGGHFRIIDFTLTNCINSNVRQIYVLTQYKSHSLGNHLKAGWSFLPRRLGHFIDEVPAQMQVGDRWYKGTADAIRQNMSLVDSVAPRRVLILSGDHIYKMDYRQMRDFHEERRSAVTVAVLRVPASEAAGRFGVLEAALDGRIVGFEEKPAEPKCIPGTAECFASMGIYLFELGILQDCLAGDADDFGQDVLPALVREGARVYAYDYTASNAIAEYVHVVRDGERIKELTQRAPDSAYWRDVGTIESYWRANLDLVSANPLFNLYGEHWPVFNCPVHLPPAKFVHDAPDRRGSATQSLVCNGVIVSGAEVHRSILGPGIFVHSHAHIEQSVLMGGGIENGVFSETMVGRRCRIRNAVIDKRVRISEGVTVGYEREVDEQRGLTIHPIEHTDEYVVVVPKGAELS